jgi:hypothetical protein
MFKIRNLGKEDKAKTPEQLFKKLPDYSNSSIAIEYSKPSGMKTIDYIDVNKEGLPSYSYEKGHIDKQLNPTLELARKWSKSITNETTRNRFLQSVQSRLEQQPDFHPDIKLTEHNQKQADSIER